jgi:predicted transcriptional regulator
MIRKNLYSNSENKFIINKTTRTLSKLKAHGIIKKVPRKNKYYLTTNGRNIISSILIYTRKQLLT